MALNNPENMPYLWLGYVCGSLLIFSTPTFHGLKVSEEEARKTVKLWYNDRLEVLRWQEDRKYEALNNQCVHTLLGRARHFPNIKSVKSSLKGHIERAAINTPVQVFVYSPVVVHYFNSAIPSYITIWHASALKLEF